MGLFLTLIDKKKYNKNKTTGLNQGPLLIQVKQWS